LVDKRESIGYTKMTGMTDVTRTPFLDVGAVYEMHYMTAAFEDRSGLSSQGIYENLPYESKAVLRIKVGMLLEQKFFNYSGKDESEACVYWFFSDGEKIWIDSHSPYFVKKVEEPNNE
jgi:hypothetical protein